MAAAFPRCTFGTRGASSRAHAAAGEHRAPAPHDDGVAAGGEAPAVGAAKDDAAAGLADDEPAAAREHLARTPDLDRHAVEIPRAGAERQDDAVRRVAPTVPADGEPLGRRGRSDGTAPLLRRRVVRWTAGLRPERRVAARERLRVDGVHPR